MVAPAVVGLGALLSAAAGWVGFKSVGALLSRNPPAAASDGPPTRREGRGRGDAATPRRDAQDGPSAADESVSARGLLLTAVEQGLEEPPTWAEVPWEGHVVLVGEHALRAPWKGRLLRLPVSFRDAVAIAKLKGWVLPTAELSDAIWRAAVVKLDPRALPPDDRMTRMGHVLRHNQGVNEQIASRVGLAADEGKDWILARRNTLKPGAATTYGWRGRSGRPLQPLGPQDRPPPHNDEHADYSQVLRPIQRFTRAGADLLELFVAQGLPAGAVEALR